jgi:hypothetical protein
VDEVIFRSAYELAEAIRRKQVSSVEVDQDLLCVSEKVSFYQPTRIPQSSPTAVIVGSELF